MFDKRYERNLLCFGIMIIIGFLGSGCALTTDTININYTQQQGVVKVPGAENVKVLVSVTDSRSVKDKVSAKKNGYGAEMAPIVTKDNIADLISTAISSELRSRGFVLTSGSVSVGVELTKFYNDFKMGFASGSSAAEIVGNVQVKKPDGNINYVKAYTGSFTETGIQLCSGDNAKKALDGAFKDFIAKMMQDDAFIKALLQAGS